MISIAEALDALVVYGPLGIFAVLSVLWALKKDKQCEEMSKQHNEEKNKLAADYAAKLQEQATQSELKIEALWEAHSMKAERWMDSYYQMSQAMHALLDAFSKKIGE